MLVLFIQSKTELLFILSAALLYWVGWLYYQHVIKPVYDEQITDYNEDAKTFTFMGNSAALFKATIIEECPDCEGSKFRVYSCCTGEHVDNDYQLCPICMEHLCEEDCETCNGQGIIELN